VACGSDDDGAGDGGTGGAGEFTLGISQPVGAVEATRVWEEGVEVQAKALGMDTVSADANLDANKQLSDVQSMISQGIDALCISPLDPEGLQPVLDDANDRGIVVIGWSAGEGASERGFATDLETDDVLAGEDAAKMIFEQAGAGAKVAAIQGPPFIPISKQRAAGFQAGVEKYGLDLVAEQINDSHDSTSGATPIADAWKAKYGSDLKGIFSYNDPSALGAAATVDDTFKPLLTGVNGSAEAIEAIAQGRLLATWDQRTVETGNACAWAAHQALTGEELPPEIIVHMPRYDASNAADWKSPEELLRAPLEISIEESDGVATLQTNVTQPEE
jgi:ribose transport system substrate-binding protein